MKNDDMEYIIYILLNEIYASIKAGHKVNARAISAERFGIVPGYLYEILDILISEGLIKGVNLYQYETGKQFEIDPNATITLQGIEFLKENNLMIGVANELENQRYI